MSRESQKHNQDTYLTDTNFISHAKTFTNFILSYTITRVTVTSELKKKHFGELLFTYHKHVLPHEKLQWLQLQNCSIWKFVKFVTMS